MGKKMSSDKDEKLKAVLHSISTKMRVTKVVATRSVKTRRGDSFAGFSAAWDSVQDDGGGPGAELADEMPPAGGMTLHEAKIAHYLLSMHTDIAATESAMASGGLSVEEADGLIRMYRNNYSKLIRRALGAQDEGSGS